MDIIIISAVFGFIMFVLGYGFGREWTPTYPFAKATKEEMLNIFKKLAATASENERMNVKK
jgi:hypothetical protein